MANIKRLGIITGGGDCGGLNGVVKGAAQMANAQGIELYVIPNGYAGLYNLVNMEELVRLTNPRADLIEANLAGSEAGHSRVKVKKINDPEKYERIKTGLDKHGIDGLIISGGDDTGSVMVDLNENGIPCVHAPKTMDLDLQTYSVGGDSTINRIANFAQELRTTGRTHNRAMVVEVFGRYAGHTAFRGGVAADADCVLIPEIPVDFDEIYLHFKRVYRQRVELSDVKAGTYLIVVAEGITDLQGNHITDDSVKADAFGHKKLSGAGKYVQKQLEARMKKDPDMVDFMKRVGMFVEGLFELPEIRTVEPGHLVRCGHSSAYDVNFGKQAGAGAVLLLQSGITGVTVADVQGNQVRYIPTADAIKQRHVDLNDVAFHETLGTCFGRKPIPFVPEMVQVHAPIGRHL